MGKGRRPEPLEKRAGKGNTQRRPMPKNSPGRVYGVPEPLFELTGNALTCWERVSVLLAKRGQLSRESALSLHGLCDTYAEWMELREDIASHGRFQTVRTTVGGEMERVRPAYTAFQDADRRLKGWLIEFGLTDASRAKVTGIGLTPPDEGDDAKPEAEDPLAKYGLN